MNSIIGIHGASKKEMGVVAELQSVQNVGVLIKPLSHIDAALHVARCQLMVAGQHVRAQLQVLLLDLPMGVAVDAKRLRPFS